MKTQRIFLYFVFGILLLSMAACSPSTPSLPGSQQSAPLPTAKVPAPAEIEQAIQRWQASHIQRYMAQVEETTAQGPRRIKVVVMDGQIVAAQQAVKDENGKWAAPAAFPLDQASEYTIPALFERIQRDAAGQGNSPLDMLAVFDPNLGFPAVVQADALPSYAENQTLLLNREDSYRLAVTVKTLLEDTFTGNQEPILTLTRSGGDLANCDMLRIYQDSSSIYTDNCSQTLLQLTLPANMNAELMDLQATFQALDERKDSSNQSQHLVIHGTGNQPADAETIAAAWELSQKMVDLLSQPIGEGITLLYTQGNALMGLDLRTFLSQPAAMQVSGNLYGVNAIQDGSGLAYADQSGLHWLNLTSGQAATWLHANQGEIYYPLSWNIHGRLLIARTASDAPDIVTLGWISAQEKTWHDLPLPDGQTAYNCVTGWNWSPEGDRLALTVSGQGQSCPTTPELAVIDLKHTHAESVWNNTMDTTVIYAPLWSEDGAWISLIWADSTSQPDQTTYRLARIQPDGTNFTDLGIESAQSIHPINGQNGELIYAIQGTTAEAGIYRYNAQANTSELLIPGEQIAPLSLSPDGNFLAYQEGTALKIWILSYQQGNQVVQHFGQLAGWLNAAQP